MRYGNKAFRTWFDRLKENSELQMQRFLSGTPFEKKDKAASELASYWVDSMGNRTRSLLFSFSFSFFSFSFYTLYYSFFILSYSFFLYFLFFLFIIFLFIYFLFLFLELTMEPDMRRLLLRGSLQWCDWDCFAERTTPS